MNAPSCLHRAPGCESTRAALPGLYSGSFYSARSVRKAMGPLESPKSENPLRKQRGLQQGGDYVRRLFKLLVIRAYLLDLLPARTVVLAFRLFDLKHE